MAAYIWLQPLLHIVTASFTYGLQISIATDGGKWWAVFHIIISVSLLGDLIGTVDELRGTP